MLKNNDSSSTVVEKNKDYVNSIALNFAAIVGHLFLIHWLFLIFHFLEFLATFDCGRSCAFPKMFNFDYPFYNLPHEIYEFLTIICTIVFILLCFLFNTQENNNKKNSFLHFLYLFYIRVGFFCFLVNSAFTIGFKFIS